MEVDVITLPRTGLALTDPRSFTAVAATATLGSALAALGAAATPLAGGIDLLYIGNEFCETLIPAPAVVKQALAIADRLGAEPVLTTPLASDAAMARLASLLPHLPEGTEVVANDWGTVALLRRAHPRLVPVAGRLLCKMVKDPRLPSAEWARLYPHGVFDPPFRALLDRFEIGRIEIDVPPFARAEDFRADGLRVAVHAPYGYAVKGRACRIGSQFLPPEERFQPGQSCGRECLTYAGETRRTGETAATDLHTFTRGNTLFYRHDDAMRAAVDEAVRAGWVDRIVISGDWNENRLAH